MTGSDNQPKLNVYANSSLVGELTFMSPGKCQFHYAASWLEHGFAISPHINFQQTVSSETLINFLKNLLPEGDALSSLLTYERLSKDNVLAILKAIGAETAGALSFHNSEPANAVSKLRPITDAELAERLSSQDTSQLVYWDGKFRLSVAGVQNKLNVYVDENQQLSLADGNYSSTHIVKFSAANYRSIVVNELFCMRLAAAVGIDVAEVQQRHFGGHHALLVTRFDRKRTEHGVSKHHMIDACQALDLPPEYKYERQFGDDRDVANIRDGVSLSKLISFARLTAVPLLTIQKMLDWLLFNLIIGNSDAHGKNISFFVGRNGISLSPFYDLVSILHEAQQHPQLNTDLAMAVGDNFDINTITAYDLLTFADEIGLKPALVKRRLDLLAIRCQNQANRLDFSTDQLTAEQQAHITNLTQLILQRCEYFLQQSRLFNAVLREAF